MPRKKKTEISNAEDSKTQKAKNRLLQCLEETSGIIAFACKKAKVSRNTFYRWCKEDVDFKEKAEDIQELQVDVAEAALLKKIKNEDTTAIIFYLKTKGKKRGYSEKTNIVVEEAPPEVDLSNLSEEEREMLLKVAEKANAGNK